jgi:hypothetical protein
MARVTDRDILAQSPAARRRARAMPRAVAASYDAGTGTITVTMASGVALIVPIAAFPELHGATEAQLSAIEIDPAGWGIGWDGLDVHYSVTGLAELVVGRAALLRAAAAAAGSVRSPAKARAARRNGRKGGRPRKAPA